MLIVARGAGEQLAPPELSQVNAAGLQVLCLEGEVWHKLEGVTGAESFQEAYRACDKAAAAFAPKVRCCSCTAPLCVS